jgi:hypothetical protein
MVVGLIKKMICYILAGLLFIDFAHAYDYI